MALSEVRSSSRHFGGLAAVDRLSFSVDEGEIRGLIGPNGAGKTTTFNVISGFYRPTAGEVIYRGETISGLKTSDIARRGLVRTFQSTTLFHEFSVLDNVLVGCHLHAPVGFVGAILGTSRAIEDAARDKALEILDFMGLAERKDEITMNLPHGHQRALGIGRALMSAPRLLLLDEPSLGLSPVMVQEIAKIIVDINDKGVSVVLVEQNAELALRLARYGYVLETGRVALEGEATFLHQHEHVKKAYLGG